MQVIMLNLLENNLNLLDEHELTLKAAEKLATETIECYWQVGDVNDKEFKRKKGIFHTEVTPTLKIVKYLSSRG